MEIMLVSENASVDYYAEVSRETRVRAWFVDEEDRTDAIEFKRPCGFQVTLEEDIPFGFRS